MNGGFVYEGLYRVQSRRYTQHSRLGGRWMRHPRLLTSATINAALSAHPLWRTGRQVELAPALVTERSGLFASEPDILYKKTLFQVGDAPSKMPLNVVDVRKASRLWAERRAYLDKLFGAGLMQEAVARLSDLELVIANEYFFHEAGHLLGADVERKYSNGHFRVDGRTAWPLIYVEEFRADMHAFGFARRMLPAADAVAVFLYTFFLRLGVDTEAFATSGAAPYGFVPALFLSALMENGLVFEHDGQIALRSLADPDLIETMEALDQLVGRELTAPELEGDDPLDIALASARYYAKRKAAIAAARTVLERSCRRTTDRGVSFTELVR